MNSIQQITPYWHNGLWVFDDVLVGLNREPFVMGASEVISRVVKDQKLKNPKRRFNLLFSNNPLPEFHLKLTKDVKWSLFEGTWYTTDEGERLWLCPSLFSYFISAPKHIWAIVKSL